jgi:hypothetical protein
MRCVLSTISGLQFIDSIDRFSTGTSALSLISEFQATAIISSIALRTTSASLSYGLVINGKGRVQLFKTDARVGVGSFIHLSRSLLMFHWFLCPKIRSMYSMCHQLVQCRSSNDLLHQKATGSNHFFWVQLERLVRHNHLIIFDLRRDSKFCVCRCYSCGQRRCSS